MGGAIEWLRPSLGRLTVIVWLAWLATLVIMAWLSFARVLHPSYLYTAIPLAIQVLGTLAVLSGGIWRVIRGPQRWRAATWVLVGMLPALWMAAYLEYLVSIAAERNHPANLLVRSAVAACSLVAEPYVRLCYPHRYEGQWFVNFPGNTSRQRGWWDLDPDCDYSVVEAKCEYLDESGALTASEHTTVEYETIEGKTVPRLARRESRMSSGGSSVITEKIESCRFGPPPAKVFELATYGDWHPEQSLTGPFAHRLILPWIAGACSLLTLLMVVAQVRFRPEGA